jgi:hypothetical protein
LLIYILKKNLTDEKMKTLKMTTISKRFKRVFESRMPAWSVILFLLILLFVACGSIELNSIWRDREVIVDGKHDDWLNALMYFEEENVSLGLFNDENFMYICLIAENPVIRNQIMMQGLTLWFDPNGGKEKIFGIQFPISMSEREMQQRRMQESDVQMKPRRDEQDSERRRQLPNRQMTEFEILGPGKDERTRMPITESVGINVSIRPSSGMLVYELKVPLQLTDEFPYAIGTHAGSAIGIRLETPKMSRQNMGRGMPGGMPGVGRGGMGGMPGGGGMRGGGMRFRMPGPLKIRAKIQLASSSEASHE